MPTRFSQVAAEVFAGATAAKLRNTQIATEVAAGASTVQLRVTQVALEIVGWTVPTKLGFVIPKFEYIGPVGDVSFVPTYPPVKKVANAPLEAMRHDSITSSGIKWSLTERVDSFQILQFDHAPESDLAGWFGFLDFALNGGLFTYYPDHTDDTVLGQYYLEDVDWMPKWNAFQDYSFTLKMRLLPPSNGVVMSTMPPFTDGCVMSSLVSQKYDLYPGSGANYSGTGGRFGGASLGLNNAVCGVNFTNRPKTVWCNFAWQVNIIPSSAGFGLVPGGYVWTAYDQVGIARQMSLVLLPTGQFAFYRGDNVMIGSPTAQVFRTDTIYYFELGVTIDGSAGSVELRVNGNPTPAIYAIAANTQKTANNFLTQQWISGEQISLIKFSDISMYDNGGGSPNSWLGSKRVYTAMPTGDSATGGLNAFGTTSPSQTSGNHYKNIKEAGPDDDTSYNADTALVRESYTVASLPGNAAFLSFVNVWSRARIDDAGPHTYRIRARSGTTDSSGDATKSPAFTYTYDRQAYANDPATSTLWLPAGFNAAEFGVEILS